MWRDGRYVGFAAPCGAPQRERGQRRLRDRLCSLVRALRRDPAASPRARSVSPLPDPAQRWPWQDPDDPRRSDAPERRVGGRRATDPPWQGAPVRPLAARAPAS